MKGSAITIRPLLLLGGATLALIALLLWSAAGDSDTATAYPGLTVGIDMNPSTTTDLNDDGLYETVDLTTFESCRQFSATPGQQLTIDVFVLDVLDLNAVLVDVEYDPAVVKIVGAYTGTIPSNLPKMFMSTQVLSSVQNQSQNSPDPSTGVLLTPDTDGKYEASFFDSSLTPPNGDDGSGRMLRFTVETVGSGASSFSFDFEDIDGNGAPDRGVRLVDVNAVTLNDADLDTWYDGPFINPSNTISVGQPDSDGDSVQDPCDPDADGDGVCDVGGPLPDGTPGTPPGGCSAGPGGSDNCPGLFNPTQSDIDGDGLGDECDTWDADGDGYINSREITYASDHLDPLSRPEVCDGFDNDGDTLVDEGPGNPPTPFTDSDADTIPDCNDTNVDTDGDTIVNTSDNDDDGDGTLDASEHLIATDSLVACDDASGLPDWPQDFDASKKITILDVVQMTPPVFNSALGDDNYERRKDLAPDTAINILDVVRMTPPVFNSQCT